MGFCGKLFKDYLSKIFNIEIHMQRKGDGDEEEIYRF